jgi:hypothetical protein
MTDAELNARIAALVGYERDFAGDANAALALPFDGDVACGLNWSAYDVYPGGAKYRAEIITLSVGGALQGYGATPALAICRAWLAWKEQQDAR